jgi:hypothetical protein
MNIIKYLWTETSLFTKIAVPCFIAAMIIAIVSGIDDAENRATRTNFCLERGYDGYKIGMRNDGDKFYCWNTVNGEIQRFKDPVQK